MFLAVTIYFLGLWTYPSFITTALSKLYTWTPTPYWAQPAPPWNLKFHGIRFSLFVFLPVVVGWLMFFVILRLVRWVKDGFQVDHKEDV